jgi:hypothetical protein
MTMSDELSICAASHQMGTTVTHGNGRKETKAQCVHVHSSKTKANHWMAAVEAVVVAGVVEAVVIVVVVTKRHGHEDQRCRDSGRGAMRVRPQHRGDV